MIGSATSLGRVPRFGNGLAAALNLSRDPSRRCRRVMPGPPVAAGHGGRLFSTLPAVARPRAPRSSISGLPLARRMDLYLPRSGQVRYNQSIQTDLEGRPSSRAPADCLRQRAGICIGARMPRGTPRRRCPRRIVVTIPAALRRFWHARIWRREDPPPRCDVFERDPGVIESKGRWSFTWRRPGVLSGRIECRSPVR